MRANGCRRGLSLQILGAEDGHAGALHLLRAQTVADPAENAQAAAAVAQSMGRALLNDPLLSHRYASLLAQARALIASGSVSAVRSLARVYRLAQCPLTIALGA